MKKSKILSVFLAVVMILTSFTVAFPAFAVDNVDSAKTLIINFNGIMKREKPREKHLEAYNKMIEAYNALSQDEVDNFDVILFNKLLLAVHDREATFYKIENPKAKDVNVVAHERSKDVIKMPAYVDEALALYNAANTIKTQANVDDFMKLLKTSSYNAVVLAGTYYSTSNPFSKTASAKEGASLIDLAAKKISAVTQSSDTANKPVMPKSVSKPRPNKYSGGESDPDYIADYKAYLAYKDAYADYTVAINAFSGEKHYLSALKMITETIPEFSYMYEIAVAALAGKRSYNETGDVAKSAEVSKIYDSIDDTQKTWLEALSVVCYAEKNISAETELGIEYGYTSYKIKALADFCDGLRNLDKLYAYENLVAATEAPYTNADIEAVKAAYEAIPGGILSLVNKDITAKYKNILAAIRPDEVSEEQPDLSAYKVTDVSYSNISEENAKELANIVIDLALKAAGVSDAKELINTKVLTNGTVLALAKLLYPLLADLTTDLINVGPKTLSNNLKEEKFAGAFAALAAAGDDWDAVVIKNGDFGFEDGDAEGFLDAAAAMLRGGSLIHFALKLENSLSTSKGTYYGAYEDLVPILEILDLKSVMSSDEYTAYVKAADNSNDAKFRAILAPIVYLLVDFGNDPINTICDVLPKVAYAIDSDIVNDGVNALLSKMSMVSVGPVDLTTAGIYKILSDKLLTPKGIKLSEDSFASLISDLSGCGTAVAKQSVARGHAYRLGIESDRAKSMVVIMTWLLDSASNNKEFVNSLLDMVITDNDILKSALKLLVGASATFIPKKLIFFLVMIFVHIANIYASISKVFGK